MDQNSKELKQIEFTREHTLTEQEVMQMMNEKLERARAYTLAVQKRKRQVDLAE